MSVEAPDFMTREPAIPSCELMLANGEYANKKTLQEVSYQMGLPVPKILTEEEASMLLAEGNRLEAQDPEAYLRRGDDEKYRVYLRGYYPSEMDMWAVDMLPTTSIPSWQYYSEVAEKLSVHAEQPWNEAYLSRHFKFRNTETGQFFLQEGDSGHIYFSTLSFGPYTFCTAYGESGRGVNWAAFYNNGHLIDGQWYFPRVNDALLELALKASNTLNDALQQKRTDFAFKHDFLLKKGYSSTFTLIQSRVASRVLTEDDVTKQEEIISRYLDSGMRLMEIEPFEARDLTIDKAPKEPFVLVLTNDMHKGSMPYPECNNLDLSNMAGLILPKNLRGGMLAHDGYRFIAYALYWGLPISLTA